MQKDTTGKFIWGNPSDPDPQSILGFPYLLCEKAPSTTGVSTPFIVLGDFKSEFESTNYKEIMNNLMLRDSYLEYTRQLTNATPKQASGSSFDIYGNPWAAPEISGEDPPQRLDYVLYRATPATLLRVVESRLCMTEAVQSGRPLSDHYGVSTLFEVTSLVAHASSWDRG